MSRVKKTEPSIKRLSLRGAKRRGNPHPLTLYVKHTAVSRRNGFPRPVTSVTGLATAAYHDSLICRLVPLGRMTEGFLTVPCLFPNGTLYQLATPQSLRDSSPRSGAKDESLPRSAAPFRVAKRRRGKERAHQTNIVGYGLCAVPRIPVKFKLPAPPDLSRAGQVLLCLGMISGQPDQRRPVTMPSAPNSSTAFSLMASKTS